MNIKVRKINEDVEIKSIKKGNWIDLRVSSVKVNNEVIDIKRLGEVKYKKGDVIFIGLGIAMELPLGYEGLVAPRSSTFKNYGLILTNSVGIIDNSYCGDNDEWMIMCYAVMDGSLEYLDRVCQFRIIESMKDVNINIVDKLGNNNRGGYGSTGVK